MRRPSILKRQIKRPKKVLNRLSTSSYCTFQLLDDLKRDVLMRLMQEMYQGKNPHKYIPNSSNLNTAKTKTKKKKTILRQAFYPREPYPRMSLSYLEDQNINRCQITGISLTD